MTTTETLPQEEQGLEDSALYNADLAPVPASRRSWSVWNYAALWISMSACIPTYMLASSLIGGGMNWWQAVRHDLPGQPDRPRADDPQRPRGHPVRHPLSGLLPGRVRHDRGERPGPAARAGGLRLVRHPDVDRRQRHLQNPGRLLSLRWPTSPLPPPSASPFRSSFASFSSGASTCGSSTRASIPSASCW